MELPDALREQLVVTLDGFLEAFASNPDVEAVTAFVIEQLEMFADVSGIEDITLALEESGQMEGSLQQSLENEFESNEELEFTGEEVISLLERACAIEWDADLVYEVDEVDEVDDFTEEEP